MGKIITMEGSDGTGKGTQTELLTRNLINMGYKVSNMSFPRYNIGFSGKVLHHIIKSEFADEYQFSKQKPEVASLPYIMNRIESMPEIERLQKESDFIIMDRYYTANLLHQGAKFENEKDRNEFIEKIIDIEINKFNIPKADIVIYLTLPYKVSIERGYEMAKYLNWNIIEGVVEDDNGNILRERDRDERQGEIMDILKNNGFIK